MSQKDYDEGMSDGLADLDPNSDRLAYGANRLNDYERGYIDSGSSEKPYKAIRSLKQPSDLPVPDQS